MIFPLATRVRLLADAHTRAPNHVSQVIHLAGIPDNTATALFTVTTAAEAGAYLCTVTALVSHAAVSGSTDSAAKAFGARFTRAMQAAGTGALSAVVEDHDDTPADTTPATRSIGNVTLTVAETTELVITASITVDLTGTDVQTAQVVALVEVLWTGFSAAPEIAPA